MNATNRLAVGDTCWHYQHGLLREGTITRVSTTTLRDNPDYLLGYETDELDAADPPYRFAPAGTVFARPADRLALIERIKTDIWYLQTLLDPLERQHGGDDD